MKKLSRKFLSVYLIMVMFLSMAPSAMAQAESTKISSEQALKIAREAFGISEKYKNIQISYREEEFYNRKKVWEFYWDLSRFDTYHSINVSVDADTGEILNYWEHEDTRQRKKPATVKTKEQCREIAETLIKKLAADKFKNTQVNPIDFPDYDYYGPKQYTFNYERVVNGTPFPENTINVRVNSETGKVSSYYFSWDNNLKFPENANTINVEMAETIFLEKGGLHLVYTQPFSFYPPSPVSSKKPVDLYYSLGSSGTSLGVIDAMNGKYIDQFGNEIKSTKKKTFSPGETGANSNNGTNNSIEKKLTMEEAREKAKSYITLPSGYKLLYSSYREGWGVNTPKQWEFQFGPDNYWGGRSLMVSINAQTGELLSFHDWGEESGEQNDKPAVYNFESCKQIAIDFLKKAAPGKAGQVELAELDQSWLEYYGGFGRTPDYYFSFNRLVNGVPFEMNSLIINVNNNTGRVTSFWSNWDEGLKFSVPESILSEKEAADKLLAVQKPVLMYVKKYTKENPFSNEVMLVYSMQGNNPRMVKADTGEIVSVYDFTNSIQLTDVDGHWAERDIRILAVWGVIAGDKANKYNPDKPITRAEFVALLTAAKGLEKEGGVAHFTDVPAEAWYFGAVQAAAKAGLVKGSGQNFYPEKVITKQEMVVMLINAVGVEPQTPVDELYGRFKDESEVASWAQDAVSRAVMMGILVGQDGYLKPTNPATKAEAAVLLTRLLERGSFEFGTSSITVLAPAVSY